MASAATAGSGLSSVMSREAIGGADAGCDRVDDPAYRVEFGAVEG